MKKPRALAVLAVIPILTGCPGGTIRPAFPRKDFEPVQLQSTEVNANYYRVGECYLAGQPTRKGLEEAKGKGVKTVLNLRGTGEEKSLTDEKAVAESLALHYVNVPVDLKALDEKTVSRFLEALRTSQKPVLIHCGSANRVSGLWAIHLVLDEGASVEEALELARKSGLKAPELEAFVREYVKKHGKS